ELKCKALADLGASINLMPLSVWKKLGLPDLILTRMTLELANRTICTPDGITRDVFVPVGKFTFPADFFVIDYESDPRVPLILGRPFLRTARALIDVYGKEMILRDGDERLTLNMKHDTASYSNHPHRDSVNLINIFNLSSEDCLEDLVSKKQSGNPTFSLHKEIASPEVIHEIHDSKGCNFLFEELLDIDSFNDIHPHFDDDPLSGSTTYSANLLLEEFADELALIIYPPDYDDNITFDRSIYLTNPDDLFVDLTPEMFTDEQPPDYSFPPRFDVYPDDFLEIESDTFDDDLFDAKGEKIKESELLIDQLDLPCDIHSEYDFFNSQDFFRDNVPPSPDNEDKGNPQQELQEKGVIDSGCSRHMTGNMSYLFNVDLRNVAPSGGLTCLFAKDTLDESNLWHKRLGYINFKTMNKLVRGNPVRCLPSKIFKNDHTCVACQKEKQHKASCPKSSEDEVANNSRKKSIKVLRKENEVQDPAKQGADIAKIIRKPNKNGHENGKKATSDTWESTLAIPSIVIG
nr:reverse transcriptase domain-containing protein [Tanacetum cinerariifolium]